MNIDRSFPICVQSLECIQILFIYFYAKRSFHVPDRIHSTTLHFRCGQSLKDAGSPLLVRMMCLILAQPGRKFKTSLSWQKPGLVRMYLNLTQYAIQVNLHIASSSYAGAAQKVVFAFPWPFAKQSTKNNFNFCFLFFIFFSPRRYICAAQEQHF